MKALEGIKVLHLYRTQPGSFAAMFLADYGADVLVIVEPGYAARLGSAGSWVESTLGMDRNKRNMTLNLKKPEGRDIFLRLVKDADVLIDGLRPGATAKLGIGYETLEKVNSRLIYAAISGYGQDGPYRRLAGHDINYMGVAGLLEFCARLDESCRYLPLVPISDAVAGIYGALGILIALRARDRTGNGQLVDVSYLDSIMSWGLTWILQERAILNAQGLTEPTGGGFYPSNNVYQTSDGKYVSVSCVEPWFWENLCRKLGKHEFIPHSAWKSERKSRLNSVASSFSGHGKSGTSSL